MPGTISEPPSVSLSFANNFWGKDDAGVGPLLGRMHNAKTTSDELKSFYSARAALEDEYSRKLLSLARKPLGSSEAGTLRMSLDVVRGEVESMGKSHQNIAQQMKTELDEQLAAFSGGMKERRKIVQNSVEKLLKVKTQQTATVNKARDRYEQDCLKIKGYLAQGHMVMGQEERKNKAKLEKTQIQLSSTSNEYEAAVKIIEETTGRWNREWKAACDKFQDLEEERIDFMKNSLWSFANIASTVCVSDDASCEKVRLSLEDCEVEKDIASFIKECGTGQEIADPPKFINFCRGDINDNASDMSADEAYSVAQFQRTMNPAFRSSSPQPSVFESHHDPDSSLAQDMGHAGPATTAGLSSSSTPRKPFAQEIQPDEAAFRSSNGSHHSLHMPPEDELPEVPHNSYPQDGMTQFCRLGPPSDRSSVASPVRPISRDSHSEYSNPTSFSSQEPSLGTSSPTKGMSDLSQRSGPEEEQKKKSGFFQNKSPFRRKSKNEMDRPKSAAPVANNWNTWAAPSTRAAPILDPSNAAKPPPYRPVRTGKQPSPSPEPTDPRASFQLNVGNNVFDVASPDARRRPAQPLDGQDEVAQALAAVKDLTKQSSVRMSADRYHGITSPAPGSSAGGTNTAIRQKPSHVPDRTREAPPPSYNPAPASRLGAPQPAFTSRQMQQTTQTYLDKNKNMYNSAPPLQQPPYQRTTPQSRPGTRGGEGNRATSPAPFRSASPRPGQGNLPRAASPNPYLNGGRDSDEPPSQSRPRAHSNSPIKPRGDGYGSSRPAYGSSPNAMPRAASPQPQYTRDRPVSGGAEMAMQLAPGPGANGGYGGQQQQQQQQQYSQPRGRAQGMPNANARPASHYGVMPGQSGLPPQQQQQQPQAADARMRSKSAGAGQQQFTREGRPILHFSRAMFLYQAAIPEELSFAKGDVLAVLRLQDDGWWEAEVVGKRSRPGLVPSNYLVNC